MGRDRVPQSLHKFRKDQERQMPEDTREQDQKPGKRCRESKERNMEGRARETQERDSSD